MKAHFHPLRLALCSRELEKCLNIDSCLGVSIGGLMVFSGVWCDFFWGVGVTEIFLFAVCDVSEFYVDYLSF